MLPARSQLSHYLLVEVVMPFSLNTATCIHIEREIYVCVYVCVYVLYIKIHIYMHIATHKCKLHMLGKCQSVHPALFTDHCQFSLTVQERFCRSRFLEKEEQPCCNSWS